MEMDWRKMRHKIPQGLVHIYETGAFSDVTLVVGPTKHNFNAHKLILMMRSEVFAVMFNDRWNSSSSSSEDKEEKEARDTVDIPDANPDSFKQFLQYFYTDTLTPVLDAPAILDVFQLAHKYQVHGLIQKCCDVITSKITPLTCIQIYETATFYDQTKLSHDAFSYLAENLDKVIDTEEFLSAEEPTLSNLLKSDDLAIEEISLFHALIKWSGFKSSALTDDDEESAKAKEEILKSMIPSIRFPIMKPVQFSKFVVPSGVLGQTDVIELLTYFTGGTGAMNTTKYSSKPRLYGENSFECYNSDSTCHSTFINNQFGGVQVSRLDGSVKVNPVDSVPQFRLKADKPVQLRGMKIYGPIQLNQKEVTFELKYSIRNWQTESTMSKMFQNLSIRGRLAGSAHDVEKTISITSAGHVDIQFEKPIELAAGQFYDVNASLTILDDEKLSPDRNKVYRYGSNNLKRNETLSRVVDGIGFTLVHEPWDGIKKDTSVHAIPDTPVGIIHSFVYSYTRSKLALPFMNQWSQDGHGNFNFNNSSPPDARIIRRSGTRKIRNQ